MKISKPMILVWIMYIVFFAFAYKVEQRNAQLDEIERWHAAQEVPQSPFERGK